MAVINTALLISNATVLGMTAFEVQKDPAVQKAWSEAASDIARAVRSVSEAASETRLAWRRASIDGRLGPQP